MTVDTATATFDSLAEAAMLLDAGVLTAGEFDAIKTALLERFIAAERADGRLRRLQVETDRC